MSFVQYSIGSRHYAVKLLFDNVFMWLTELHVYINSEFNCA